MEKKLNIASASIAMEKVGLSQADIADQLSVSREAVSKWLSEKTFPRPNKLLQLAKLLGLSFNELVVKEDPNSPVVAFRKKKGTKTTQEHITKAEEMGRILRNLVPYLPFDNYSVLPTLKSPTCDYDYLCNVTDKVRRDINLAESEQLSFEHLITYFKDLQAVVVPVLWGTKSVHENAIHIYLPDTETTWVYLNLDVNVHDFKFWMAHELGHCLSPQLRGEEAEDFADNFAGSLLFPRALAEQAYEKILSQHSLFKKITVTLELASEHYISPYTIVGQVNKFADHAGKARIELGKGIHGAVTNFNKQYENLSTSVLGDIASLDAKDYIGITTEVFKTPFFEALSCYLKEKKKGSGFVQTVTLMPLLDARSIHSELA